MCLALYVVQHHFGQAEYDQYPRRSGLHRHFAHHGITYHDALHAGVGQLPFLRHRGICHKCKRCLHAGLNKVIRQAHAFGHELPFPFACLTALLQFGAST